MKGKKYFFPKDWLGNRPYKTIGEADIYYFGIASMVYDLLKRGGMEDEVFKTTEKPLPSAPAPGIAPLAGARSAGEGVLGILPGFGSVPRVRRNDPCPCGSGLKYKNCHGKWES